MGITREQGVYSEDGDQVTYLDIQAAVGVSKHLGGYSATDELYKLCHIDRAKEVLEVGCGIGTGPAYIARKLGCQVKAVDISEKMLDWAEGRACHEGLADLISFHKADVRELPFEDASFDVVIEESVLAFVKDKQSAIQEMIRVTRPGGYVGLNESYWISVPSPELIGQSISLGTEIPTESEWETIWGATGLEQQVFRAYKLEPKKELGDRIKWVGWRWILPAWARAFKLVVSNPGFRQSMKEQFNIPKELMDKLGYILLCGRKYQGEMD